MRKLRIVLVVALVVLVAAGGAVWWFLLRDDAPPPPRLAACAGDADGELTSAPAGSLDGTWTLAAPADDDGDGDGDGDDRGGDDGHGGVGDADDEGDAGGDSDGDRYVGYRIAEVFGGDVVSRDAVARTMVVDGSLTVTDDQLTAASIVADVSELSSTDAASGGRDRYLRTNALETDEFPEARFELTDPVDLGPLPESGACVQVAATGVLTLRDQETTVAIALDATWHPDRIEIAGSAPLELADVGIEAPDVAGFATVEDEGAFEVRLSFVPDAVPSG